MSRFRMPMHVCMCSIVHGVFSELQYVGGRTYVCTRCCVCCTMDPTPRVQLLEDIDEHNTSKLKLADFQTLLSR